VRLPEQLPVERLDQLRQDLTLRGTETGIRDSCPFSVTVKSESKSDTDGEQQSRDTVKDRFGRRTTDTGHDKLPLRGTETR
jgi:hypothetical protein